MKTSESKSGSKTKKTSAAAKTAKTTTASAAANTVKTTTAAAAVKTEKTIKSPVVKAVRTKKSTVTKQMPGDAEISKKAYEIYTERTRRGEPGSAHGDWTKAIDMLMNP